MSKPAHNFVDITGRRFGRLTVIKRAENSKRKVRWLCKCSCGIEKIVRGSHLRAGKIRSCGCLLQEILRNGNGGRIGERKPALRHGKSKSPEYEAWCGMKRRCKDDPDYAGRGIVVCNAWCNSFEAFYAHVGSRPSPQHSIDRLNNDGNYEPGNVAWRTQKEQANNRRPRRWRKAPHRIKRGINPEAALTTSLREPRQLDLFAERER